jgi:hypothetical protein
MHHKRKRPKHQRAGCLLCKPWKDERLKKELPANDQRKLQPVRNRKMGLPKAA